MKNIKLLVTFMLSLFLVSYAPKPEEGMYPVSFLESMDLTAMGLGIDANEIFNPNGNGLINAIVNLNGCTGSFVSNDGLILTNHHCVFSSLRPHTTEKNNYMRDGFLAQDKLQELPMEGFRVKIMKSYKDISSAVLKGVASAKSALERDEIIRKNIAEIREEEEKANPSMEINISEMLVGASYFVFRYEFLDDVRLVYVPARYIGEFGGETDNWMWPRHSGDFSFVRAYTSKDGKPAKFNKDNIPYKPQRFLKVNPQGVGQDDLVFILGYPGTTFRHYPASFINYMETVQMPYISETWAWQIDYMERLAKESDANMIKYSNRIKRLANTTKNYKGKLQSLRRIGLAEKKKEEEFVVYEKLQATNTELAENYQATLDEMNRIYKEMTEYGPRRFWFYQMRTASNYYSIARMLNQVAGLLESDASKYTPELAEKI
ncbi:MAG: S46 family peptidase, partial [Bacteroidetes bacterium]|nr:S46 family peptidase [Bacteroidota bacterium]